MQTLSEIIDGNQKVKKASKKPFDVKASLASSGLAVFPIQNPAPIKIEPGRVYMSTNYAAFKNFPSNRIIGSRKREELVKAMTKNYLISPILVNEDLMIIDGQHRHAAAEELGYPFFFIVKEGLTENDIPLYNTNSKDWVFEDYLDAFANISSPEYLKLRQYMQTYDMPLSQALVFFAGIKDYHTRHNDGNDSKSIFTASFENGSFKLDRSIDPVNDEVLNKFNDIRQAMSVLISAPIYKQFAYGVVFTRACIEFIKSVNYKHSQMLTRLAMPKLASIIELLAKTKKRDEIFALLRRIYNFNTGRSTVFELPDPRHSPANPRAVKLGLVGIAKTPKKTIKKTTVVVDVTEPTNSVVSTSI